MKFRRLIVYKAILTYRHDTCKQNTDLIRPIGDLIFFPVTLKKQV